MANKLKSGGKIRIKKQIFIEKGSNFSLDVGEVFTIEAISVTGSAKVTKQYANGVTKKAVVSKAFYERV
jgi:hypothetical protein